MTKQKLTMTHLMLEPQYIRFHDPPDAVEMASGNATEHSLPKFSMVAYTGGKAFVANFPCPIVVDVAGIDIPQQKIPARFEHKSFQGVGHTEKVAIVGTEVLAEGVVSRDTSWARDVALSGKNGFPWQASMGGAIHETEYIPFGQTVTVNGQTFEGELYVIRKLTLSEISFVDLGADKNTSAVITCQDGRLEENTSDLNNISSTRMSMTGNENTESLETMISGLQSKVSALESQATSLEPLIIDNRRIAQIHQMGGAKFPELEAKAIEEGWSVEKFQGEYRNKIRTDASEVQMAGISRQGETLKASALEAIALASSGASVKFLEAQYETQTLDKAKPATNPHAGKYETVSSPHLGSKVFKGNSATAWYLLADPRRLAAYEVAFLGGQERPTVERADADFNILGIQFRGFIDFGVKEQDHRGALKLDPAT